MQHRWLTLISFAVITVIVFTFFVIRLQPVDIPTIEQQTNQVGTLLEPSITFVNPARGAINPKVTIIEYGDFQCPHCRSMATSMDAVLQLFPNEVKHIWKNLPNDAAHPLATQAAVAAHCADRQGAFWEYHHIVFDRQAFLSPGQFTQIASELELDQQAFDNCFQSQDTLPIVNKDYEEGLALGLEATPTVFVNNSVYIGATSTEDLILYVQQALENR